MSINSRRDLLNYVSDRMGENGNDSATEVVFEALREREDMPAYGAGSAAWNGFLEPLDFWQIHEAVGSSFIPPVCHPKNVLK